MSSLDTASGRLGNSSRDLEIVDRGPAWLFVRVHPNESTIDNLADRLWALLNQHFIYRLVLEMEEIDFMPSRLMGQLVMLQKRVMQHGGALRLCKTTPQCQQALHSCRLDQVLPSFDSRAEAVHGYAPRRAPTTAASDPLLVWK